MDYPPIAAHGLIGDLQTAAQLGNFPPVFTRLSLIKAAVNLDRHPDGGTMPELTAA